jgi:hypothetical protein
MGMEKIQTPKTHDERDIDLDRELESLLKERRPDHRGPRGNQEVETVDVERGREKLDRVVGW